MPAIAQKDGASTVAATDGAKGSACAPGRWNWNVPTTQASDAGSANVFAENIGVVRDGDAMLSHPDGVPCTSAPIPHAPQLNSFSPNVFANNKAVGRIGDKYDSDGHFDHTITSGAGTVFAN